MTGSCDRTWYQVRVLQDGVIEELEVWWYNDEKAHSEFTALWHNVMMQCQRYWEGGSMGLSSSIAMVYSDSMMEYTRLMAEYSPWLQTINNLEADPDKLKPYKPMPPDAWRHAVTKLQRKHLVWMMHVLRTTIPAAHRSAVLSGELNGERGYGMPSWMQLATHRLNIFVDEWNVLARKKEIQHGIELLMTASCDKIEFRVINTDGHARLFEWQ